MRPSTIPLDAFDLTEVVGRGSAGSVWRARHRQPNGEGTALAIKLLTGAHARSDSGAAAFRREVRAVAALDHPHIVRIYEHGQVGSLSPFPQEEDIPSGSPYLAMDLLEGGTLTSRAGRLDWPDLKGVLLALLDGLGHAHARGVLHRDIKPSNIMLGPTGLTITDFGLSYRPDEGGSAVEQLAGTPAYMAPEQFSGNWRDFGSWTDLYAVGCTAFALACARPPYGARMTPAASMEGHLYGRLPQVKSYRAVPTGFEAWIHRLIQKAPRDRFRLAAEAAHELRKLDPSSHRTPTRPEATNSFPDHRHDEDERALRPRIAGLGLGLYGLRTPRLTGRANERDVLWAALAEVHRSRSVQVRVISGGAGTGKSRLAEWIGERAMERGVGLALRVVHSPSGGPSDGLPAAARRALRCEDLTRPEVRKHLLGVAADDQEFTTATAESITELLSPQAVVTHPTPSRRTEKDGDTGPSTIRFQSAREQNRAVESFLKHWAGEQAVVLWLDDVQWGLDSIFFARDLLKQEGARRVPLLIVMTCRDDLLEERRGERDLLAQVLDFPEASELVLGALSSNDRSALIGELLGMKGTLADRLVERTAGNPLFAVQLVGDWVDRGLLKSGPDGFELRAGVSLQLPDNIHEVWSARIESFLKQRPPADGEALELAAMLGQHVDEGEWRAACARLELTPSPDLVEVLAQLCLVKLPRDVAITGRWDFVHGMLRESCQRRSWAAGRAEEQHRACEGVLAGQSGPVAAARRTHHLFAAGAPAEAIDCAATAAEGFIEQGLGRRAEALLDERDAAMNSLAIPATDERRVRGLLFRSFIARAAKQLKEASELAQRTEDLARTGGFDSLRANALRSRGTSLRSLGQLDESVRIFDESVLLSDRIGDTQCFADALRGRGFALIELGQHQEAEDSLSDALALYREVGDNYGVASAQLSLARLASTAGQFERVQMHAKAGLNDARRLGNRGLLAGFFNQLGEAARGLEQFTEADRYYEQAIHIVRELQDPWRGIIEANRGLVLIELQSWEAAHEILRGAQRSLARTQAPVASAMVSTFLLPCLAALGHWEQFGTELSAAREGLERSGRTELDLARMPDKAAILATQAGKRVEAEGALSLARAQWVAQGSAAEVRRIDALLTAL